MSTNTHFLIRISTAAATVVNQRLRGSRTSLHCGVPPPVVCLRASSEANLHGW